MKRIMIDASKCDGCKSCSVACMQATEKMKAMSIPWTLRISPMRPGILFTKILMEATLPYSAATATSRNV